jgi:hypothetical protein
VLQENVDHDVVAWQWHTVDMMHCTNFIQETKIPFTWQCGPQKNVECFGGI